MKLKSIRTQWYPDANEIVNRMGFNRLPTQRVWFTKIDDSGVFFYIKPLDPTRKLKSGSFTQLHRRQGHRLMAVCVCGKHLSAGRLHQHTCKGVQS